MVREVVRSGEASRAAEIPDGELDFRAVGRALWRKKLWVLIPAALVAVAAFAAVNIVTPRYKSEARLLIEGRENVFLRPEAEKAGDRERGLVDQEAVTSQVQLALSREVARQVIKQLKLEERPEFDPLLRGMGPLRNILIQFGLARDPARMSAEERVFETYYERVQAYQVDKSRVIAIEFQSADPELAARGANVVAEAYLVLLQVVKQEQTKAAGQWLAGEIETLRTKVAEAESKVEQFRSKSNLFVGPNNNTLSHQQLGEVNSQVAVARAQKAEADARARLIREMLRSGRPIETSDITNSELIRRLNEQRVTLRAQLAEQSSTLLDGHPRIKELRAQIADLERQIRAEAEMLVRSLENDARLAAARAEQLSAVLEQLKRQAASTNEQDVQLRALEREAKAQRDLLESYLAKYREAAARENLGAAPADVRIISRAIVSNTPYFPKKAPTVLLAALATLLIGIGFVTTGELLAGNVYRPGGVGTSFAPANDGPVRIEPHIASRVGVRSSAPRGSEDSFAAVVEALSTQANGHSRTAVVGLAADASSAATALALGRALTPYGRVVVIDLALAPPQVGRLVATGQCGIADLVTGKATFGEVICRDQGSRAHVIAAGEVDDAAAVLASERLAIGLDALERAYEHVIMHVGALSEVAPSTLVRLAPSFVIVGPAGSAELEAACERTREAGGRNVYTLADSAEQIRQSVEPAAVAA